MKEIHLKRSEAAELIEGIRELLAEKIKKKDPGGLLFELDALLQSKGIEYLKPCTGQAHSPEVGGMQDNCSLCAPRWAWCGPKIVVR